MHPPGASESIRHLVPIDRLAWALAGDETMLGQCRKHVISETEFVGKTVSIYVYIYIDIDHQTCIRACVSLCPVLNFSGSKTIQHSQSKYRETYLHPTDKGT